MSDQDLTFFVDADFEPWACFAWGDVPPETITAPRIRRAALDFGVDEKALDLDAFTVTTFWIRPGESTTGDFDEVWQYCAAVDAGAQRVTGVRFQ